MTNHTTPLDLDDIETRAAHLYEYGQMDNQDGQNALDQLTDTDVPALLAEVRRLRDRVAELEPDSALLAALEAGGVDNWDGYDDACEAAVSAVSGAADSRQA